MKKGRKHFRGYKRILVNSYSYTRHGKKVFVPGYLRKRPKRK